MTAIVANRLQRETVLGDRLGYALAEIVAIHAADALMTKALALRHEVFVVEQLVPQELEIDEDDKIASHLVALCDGRVVGTLRIVSHDRKASIGRIAVSVGRPKDGARTALE
jgi:predicted GNAT family N-acyltransferase